MTAIGGGAGGDDGNEGKVVVVVVVKAKDSTRDASAGHGHQRHRQVWECLLSHRRHVRFRRRPPRGQIGSHKVAWRKWIDRSDAADRNITPVRISDPGGCAVADHDSITRLQLGSPGNRRETLAAIYQRGSLIANNRERKALVLLCGGALITAHGLVCGWCTLITGRGSGLPTTRGQG